VGTSAEGWNLDAVRFWKADRRDRPSQVNAAIVVTSEPRLERFLLVRSTAAMVPLSPEGHGTVLGTCGSASRKACDASGDADTVAAQYDVSRAWVHRLIQRPRETGSLRPRQQTTFRRRALTDRNDERLAALIPQSLRRAPAGSRPVRALGHPHGRRGVTPGQALRAGCLRRPDRHAHLPRLRRSSLGPDVAPGGCRRPR
jgi:hypothetical protein